MAHNIHMANCEKKFVVRDIKVIELPRGSHKAIGRALGEGLREEISRSLNIYFDANKNEKGKTAEFQSLLRIAKKEFPAFVEEAEGIAEGSNQPLELILRFSFEEELVPGEHCTSVAIKKKGKILYGHNENWDLSLDLYVAKVKPDGKPAFLSVGYAGQFPIMGLNEEGVAFSGNSVETTICYTGLPKTYLLRSFLETRNIKDAISRVSNAKTGRSIGNISIIASAKESRMVQLEWSPERVDSLESDSFLTATNYFKSGKMQEYQHWDKADVKFLLKRLGRLDELAKSVNNLSLDSMKKILRDHFNKPESICKHEKGDGTNTIGSLIMEPAKGKLHFAYGKPCETEYTEYKL